MVSPAFQTRGLPAGMSTARRHHAGQHRPYTHPSDRLSSKETTGEVQVRLPQQWRHQGADVICPPQLARGAWDGVSQWEEWERWELWEKWQIVFSNFDKKNGRVQKKSLSLQHNYLNRKNHARKEQGFYEDGVSLSELLCMEIHVLDKTCVKEERVLALLLFNLLFPIRVMRLQK